MNSKQKFEMHRLGLTIVSIILGIGSAFAFATFIALILWIVGTIYEYFLW